MKNMRCQARGKQKMRQVDVDGYERKVTDARSAMNASDVKLIK